MENNIFIQFVAGFVVSLSFSIFLMHQENHCLVVG